MSDRDDVHMDLWRMECYRPAPLVCNLCHGEAEGNYSDNDGPVCNECVRRDNETETETETERTAR